MTETFLDTVCPFPAPLPPLAPFSTDLFLTLGCRMLSVIRFAG